MNSRKFLIISIFLFGFMGAADVFASSHSKHVMHDHGVVSPFDKKQGGKPLHCLLNNHSYSVLGKNILSMPKFQQSIPIIMTT
jgi:hypothetical protein